MTREQKLKILGYWVHEIEFIHRKDRLGGHYVYAKYWYQQMDLNIMVPLVTFNCATEEEAIDVVLTHSIEVAKRMCGVPHDRR